jgi:hypothetical protein
MAATATAANTKPTKASSSDTPIGEPLRELALTAAVDVAADDGAAGCRVLGVALKFTSAFCAGGRAQGRKRRDVGDTGAITEIRHLLGLPDPPK